MVQSKPGEVRTAVAAAIEAGYRLIDTALIYGNEKEIGEAIQAKIKEGKIKREDIFVTTKAPPPLILQPLPVLSTWPHPRTGPRTTNGRR